MPIAPVASTHFVGDKEKLFSPAWALNLSNSGGLNSGLWICSQMPRNSTVLRLRSQLYSTVSSANRFTMSVSEM